MKKLFLLSILAFYSVYAAKPMESLKNYNVILVHGAADMRSGLDCKSGDKVNNAYQTIIDNKNDYSIRIGGYKDWALPWDDNFHGGFLFQLEKTGATGMLKELRPWLESSIFEEEDALSTIYLQRPFVNPANSPFENGKEIGDRTWQGENKCADRRSLIEEAQEVKAGGRDTLKTYRNNPKLRDSLPPSRNILIAHSMGGVASREYVQGDNYKEDVDKVITLDSPHEGTEALSLLISKHEDWLLNAVLSGTQFMALAGTLSFFDDALSNYNAIILWAIGVSYGLQEITDLFYLRPYFPYTSDDPLAYYIDPDNFRFRKESGKNIKDLKDKEYNPNMQTPMFRLLYATQALTFTDPKDSFLEKMVGGVLPDALYVSMLNFFNQFDNDNPMDLKINSAFASMYMGALLGFGFEENGSSLIPDWSGSAANTPFLSGSDVDVKKVPYKAAFNSADISGFASIIETAGVAMIAAGASLSWNPQLKLAAKLGIMTSAALYSLPLVATNILPFIMDFEPSHKAPTDSTKQKEWFGAENTYTKIQDGQETVKPYRMEEFLYEKPFVNLKVHNANDALLVPLESNRDSLGLYGYETVFDTTYHEEKTDSILSIDSIGVKYTSLVVLDSKNSKTGEIDFKTSAGWESVGIKKERWEYVKGVDSDSVPIRHADRYAMPGFSVKGFIDKYEFEVDDLMPHRLRQIRLNFNFNEDIAWECDVSKPEGAMDVCTVFMRTGGGDWVNKGKSKHPVEKDGTFIFEPEKEYYKDNILAIQKDNQNTVTITTVNKIGLTNSQRFYYLFKATSDLVEPIWAVRNAKLSKIEDFKAYANFLDYQGYHVISGRDCIEYKTGEDIKEICADMDNLQTYEFGWSLDSKLKLDELSEGKYDWRAKIKIGNSSNDTTESEMFVPFELDKTKPETQLILEQEVMNSKKAAFLSRLTTDESLRMSALFLKQNNTTLATAKYKNIIARDFSIKLSDFGLEKLSDGKYELVSYSFDGAVGSLDEYNFLNRVVDGDKSLLYELIDGGKVVDAGKYINYHKDSAEFYLDTKAPEFVITTNPTKSSDTLILNQDQDSLLKIKLDVKDINGKPAAVVNYNIIFREDGEDAFQLGGKIDLANGVGVEEWTETPNTPIADGNYKMIVSVWDEAGNMGKTEYEKTIRIDRTPPKIKEVASSQFTYEKGNDNYSATLFVSQPDKAANLSKMNCSYRINGGDSIHIAHVFENKAEEQKFTFDMDREAVGTGDGKRRLEVECIDWAGNVSSTFDLFGIGYAPPSISYPPPQKTIYIKGISIIAISGMAPKHSANDYDTASYKLEWRNADNLAVDATWKTTGIDVGPGKRANESTYWQSNSVQSEVGDLGFLDMKDQSIGNYEIMLSVKDCPTCEWRGDTVSFYYSPPEAEENANALRFAVGSETFTPNSGFLPISLGIEGAAQSDFRVRVYAQDSKGNPLFNISADTLSASPYEGARSLEGSGRWFWSEGETYNLSWKDLPEGESIAVHYAAGDIDESICQTGCTLKDTLLAALAPDVYAATGLIKEMHTPQGLNKAMIFSGSSGNVQFNNKKAFWLKMKNNMDTTQKVHFGKRANSLDSLVLFSGNGVQVNPELYGLYYDWNGMASNGSYPQGGTVYFYAEAIENKSLKDYGVKVLRASAQAQINKADLKILLDSAVSDDFYLITYEGDTTSLGKKIISYGISGRDADVSAYIKKSDRTVVKKFFEDKFHTTSNSQNAYSLTWDGTDDEGYLQMEGDFYFEIIAKESGVIDSEEISDGRNFKISYAPNVEYVSKDTPSNVSLSLLYADSLKDRNDFWHYTPVADYLVKADATGKWLPEDSRSLDVKWGAEGTQAIYGYRPHRFSLAVKRQRETLPLVIVYRIKANQRHQRAVTWDGGCAWRDSYQTTHYGIDTLTFKTGERIKYIPIDYERRKDDDYGFDPEKPISLDVWAIQLNYYEDGKKKGKYKNYEELIDAIGKKSLITVWEISKNIPNRYQKNESISNELIDVGCEPNMEEGIQCTEETENYNPNANLFKFTASPNSGDGYFLTPDEDLGPGCNDYGPKHIKIGLTLEIPKEQYWNIGYGYDNLVNRTIRIDQTNITMYGEKGYLKKVSSNYPFYTFYNGEKSIVNYNYGMLTPFETQIIPFFPASDIPSGNAFTFPDEELGYEYPSYFSAYFYNINNKENMKFRADIYGSPVNTGDPYSYTLKTGTPLEESKLFEHGSVDIEVSMEATPSAFQGDTVTVSYPYTGRPKDTCRDHNYSKWIDSAGYYANCHKFYDSGSKIHHELGDFTEEQWEKTMLTSTGHLSNPYLNKTHNPFSALVSKEDNFTCAKSFDLKPEHYSDSIFYLPTECRFTNTDFLKAIYKPDSISENPNDDIYFSNDTIYFKAKEWTGKESWRRLDTLSHKGLRDYPTHEKSQYMPITDFFPDDPWIRDRKINSAKITNLNDSLHTHFIAAVENDNGIRLTAKNPPDVKRPSEFIAVTGTVPSPGDWKILYLNNQNLQGLASGKTESIHEWFDVNRLQGNTSVLLQWGGEGSMLSIRKLDLEIGGKVTSDSGGLVQSLFGEVSVVFPEGILKNKDGNIIKDTVVTVRTADADDYAFKTFNNAALVGPVIEILPSWDFKDAKALPRIKARITEAELRNMNISPSNVRLYKIDFENKKFVELQKTYIGFDKEEECSPGEGEDYKKCNSYSPNWKELLISAETQTFSTFAFIDKNVVDSLFEVPVTDPVPSQIACSIPIDTLWLGIDNGYLKLQQECNQPAMGILQVRKDGKLIAERNQSLPDALIWNGSIGLNKIPNGEYSSRYLAISPLGSEMQIVGPVILTDSLRPQISGFGVGEHSELLDRAFTVSAKIKDNESGVENILLKWKFDGTTDSVYLSADSSGNVSHKIAMPKSRLSNCLGCKLIISLSAEDFGHNRAEREWISGELYPYPQAIALWYPALEGAGKTVYEKTGTKHDLALDMKTPWLSASGLYFDESGAGKATGIGSVDLGVLEEYTLEAWVRPGYQYESGWRRILGFNAADGRNVEVFIDGKSARLSDGTRSWIAKDVFLQNKVWTHFSATVSASGVNFYSDGKPVFSAIDGTQERIWSGSFSVGAGNSAQAFVGHVMQARFYKRALSEEEIYALYRNIGGDDDYNVEIILANDLQNVSGGYLGFNCAAPGANYWTVENSQAVVKGNFWADKAGTYKAILYARAAVPNDYAVKAGAMQGTVSAQSVWRPLLLDNANLELRYGFNEIQFTIPSGLEVAGIALSNEPELAVHAITWNMEANPVPSGSVKVQHIFEGADAGMIRPRLSLTNTGSNTINGLKVRYYFRGEDPSQVVFDKFYPHDGAVYVRREGSNLGYAEWSFPNMKIAPGESPFWGQGPHFGLHNTDYTPWIAKDDPSYLAEGIVVLDANNRMLAGSCIEDESPLKSVPEVKVTYNDAREDNSASHLYITLDNIGSVPIKNYELRYYFNAFGEQPVFDVYDMQNLSAELKNFGEGKWAVSIVGKNSLGPGIAWRNPAQFALHFANWQNWDKTNFAGIAVFDSLGNKIYGSEPNWKTLPPPTESPSEKPNAPEPNVPDSPIEISRTPEGLIVSLKEASHLKLDLVDVSGVFRWSMFDGHLSKGQNLIPSTWGNLELERTYIVVRLNGNIYPAKLLSEL